MSESNIDWIDVAFVSTFLFLGMSLSLLVAALVWQAAGVAGIAVFLTMIVLSVSGGYAIVA